MQLPPRQQKANSLNMGFGDGMGASRIHKNKKPPWGAQGGLALIATVRP
jgi:hypothetical protein